jgi:hypothetical protein
MGIEESEDWLMRRAETLRPGWRGRLHVRTPEQAADESTFQIVGTIVGEPSIDSDDDGVAEGYVTLCFNYRHGRFGSTPDESCIDINLSWITGAEAM